MFSQTQPPLGLSAVLITHMVNSKPRRFSAKNVKPSSFKPFSRPSSSIPPPKLSMAHAKAPSAIFTPCPLKMLTSKYPRGRMGISPGVEKGNSQYSSENWFFKIMMVLESKAADGFHFGKDFKGAQYWVWLGLP